MVCGSLKFQLPSFAEVLLLSYSMCVCIAKDCCENVVLLLLSRSPWSSFSPFIAFWLRVSANLEALMLRNFCILPHDVTFGRIFCSALLRTLAFALKFWIILRVFYVMCCKLSVNVIKCLSKTSWNQEIFDRNGRNTEIFYDTFILRFVLLTRYWVLLVMNATFPDTWR